MMSDTPMVNTVHPSARPGKFITDVRKAYGNDAVDETQKTLHNHLKEYPDQDVPTALLIRALLVEGFALADKLEEN